MTTSPADAIRAEIARVEVWHAANPLADRQYSRAAERRAELRGLRRALELVERGW